MLNADGRRFHVMILPMPPNRGNTRGHTRFQTSAKNKYFALCDSLFHQQGYYPFRLPPLEKTTWHAEFFVKQKTNLMDFDNMVARLKWPFDYLKLRKLIVDDSWDKFWPNQLPTQQVAKDGKPMLQLTIIEEYQ